jgi:hypothetical protein
MSHGRNTDGKTTKEQKSKGLAAKERKDHKEIFNHGMDANKHRWGRGDTEDPKAQKRMAGGSSGVRVGTTAATSGALGDRALPFRKRSFSKTNPFQKVHKRLYLNDLCKIAVPKWHKNEPII